MTKHSLVVFDRYLLRGKCAIAVIAACSILERAVGRAMGASDAPTFHDWDGVIGAASKLVGIVNASGNRQPAFRYLQRPDLNGLLMRDGGRGPLEPVAELLTELAKSYFEVGKPLSALDTSSALSGELVQLGKRVRDAAQSKHWYKKQLIEIEDAGRKQAPFSAFLKRLGGDVDVPHPDFPGLSLISDLAIASEFHHLAPLDTAKLARRGLFVVLREARGWTVDSQDSQKTNTIVRDLLWIEDMSQVVQGKRPVQGLYYSAYDKKAIEVTATGDYEDALKLKNILVTAKQAEDADQRFQLFFPITKATGSTEVRDAIIAGTGRDATQLGAWKALLTEPGWNESERLETLIHVLRNRGEPPARLEQCLLNGGYCGVLYHDGMRDAFAIRDSFRKLLLGGRPQMDAVRDFGGFIDNQIRAALDKVISDLRATPINETSVHGTVDRVLGELNALLRQRWHLVEPAQIITLISESVEHRGFSPEECNKLLLPLLALKQRPRNEAA